jgi:hypothetical protein
MNVKVDPNTSQKATVLCISGFSGLRWVYWVAKLIHLSACGKIARRIMQHGHEVNKICHIVIQRNGIVKYCTR